MFLFLVLINVTWTLLFNLVLLVFFVPFPTILIIVMGGGGFPCYHYCYLSSQFPTVIPPLAGIWPVNCEKLL